MPHAQVDMNAMRKYIFGSVNSNVTLKLFVPTHFSEEVRCGLNGVYAITYKDISVLVSDSEIIDYTHMSKDTLAKLLVMHQKVIEAIMDLGYTIIPVRLGTLAADEIEVKDILNKGYSLIKNIMYKINNKVEIDVVATWNDFNSILKKVGEEKEIKELKERLFANPKEITIDEQMKVGVMIKKALDKRREEHDSLIRILLNTISQDFKAHELMDDKMVANLAFLIDKTKQEDFDRKVEELNIKFHNALNFRCVGPLPPYSFYTLEIKKMQFEEINWAMRKFNLSNDFTSKEEIKKSYHKLAFIFHPDKNTDSLGKNDEFNEVTKAYRILLDYCQDERCSFKEEDFKKNSLIVKVKY